MLPIALKSFHIKNYRGIIDTQIDNIPDNTQWIFLTGENGFGKTSVLQGITDSISYMYSNSSFNSGSLENVDIELDVNYRKDNKLITQKRHLALNRYLNKIDFPNTNTGNIINERVAYGSSRFDISDSSNVETFSKTNLCHIFSTNFNRIPLLNIEENFKNWYKEYPEGKKKLEALFVNLLPNLERIEVEFNDLSKVLEVKYYEIDDTKFPYKYGLTFEKLASGYKNIIAMIGDMVYRLGAYQPDINSYSQLKGIVLIDEIELHLHPKYQKLFVEKLTELFPKIQFIVSTHSPIPLLGAPKNSVIINVSRTKEEGIKAELLDIDFSVLTPNTILSSPIFGFQDLIPDSKSNDKMIRTEDTYKEVLFHDQLDKQIDEFLTEENKQELLDLLKVK